NAGFWDLDGDRNGTTSNGCEYGHCTVSGPDAPADAFVDANCDGIDGDPANAIFVAAPPLGNDTHPGTRALPNATITNGVSAALAAGKRELYVGTGTYPGPLTLVAGVSIYGGYDPAAGWRRNASSVTSIVSTQPVGV